MGGSAIGHDTIVLPRMEGQDVVFDLDGTLLQGDLGETVFYRILLEHPVRPDGSRDPVPDQRGQAPYLAQGKRAQELDRYQTLFSQGDREQAYRFTADVLSRFPDERVRAAAREVLSAGEAPSSLTCVALLDGDVRRDFVLEWGARIRPMMARLVPQMLERAARLWIVSASPQAVAEGCGDLLQFPRRNILATVVEPGPHGNPRFPWRKGKLAALHAAGVHRPLLVFGNGLEDCEMLEAASIPIAMADGNSKLLEVAGERHWQILGPRTKVEFTP